MWPADDWASQNVCASFMLCPFVIGHVFVETPYLNMCFRHLEKLGLGDFPAFCYLLGGQTNKTSFSVMGRSLHLATFSLFAFIARHIAKTANAIKLDFSPSHEHY